MVQLALASIVFLVLHIVPGLAGRAWIVRKIGDPAYMGLFSLASILSLAWMVTAYYSAPAGQYLWVTGPAARWATAAVMLFAFILVVTGAISRNPSSVLGRSALQSSYELTGIFAITRHPVMWGVALWAFLHLLNRPDARSLLFFGTMAVLAIAGTLLQERRKLAEFGEPWRKFAAQTSHVPFAAMLSGKTSLDLRAMGGWQLATAVALWLVVMYFHEPVLGVSPLLF